MFTNVASNRTLAPGSACRKAECRSCRIGGGRGLGLSSRLSMQQPRGVKANANALASNSYSRSLGSLYGLKGPSSKVSLGLGNTTKTSERGSLASSVRAVKPEVGDRIIASGE